MEDGNIVSRNYGQEHDYWIVTAHVHYHSVVLEVPSALSISRPGHYLLVIEVAVAVAVDGIAWH
jgi:hypothetical protein